MKKRERFRPSGNSSGVFMWTGLWMGRPSQQSPSGSLFIFFEHGQGMSVKSLFDPVYKIVLIPS